MKIIRLSHHFDRGLFYRGFVMIKKNSFIPIVCVSTGVKDGIECAKVIKLQAQATSEAAERAAYEAFRKTIGAMSFTVEEVLA